MPKIARMAARKVKIHIGLLSYHEAMREPDTPHMRTTGHDYVAFALIHRIIGPNTRRVALHSTLYPPARHLHAGAAVSCRKAHSACFRVTNGAGVPTAGERGVLQDIVQLAKDALACSRWVGNDRTLTDAKWSQCQEVGVLSHNRYTATEVWRLYPDDSAFFSRWVTNGETVSAHPGPRTRLGMGAAHAARTQPAQQADRTAVGAAPGAVLSCVVRGRAPLVRLQGL